jgi:hypothetical protein
MSTTRGTASWLVFASVAVVVAVGFGTALAGTASASPALPPTASPSGDWAYGGVGYSNGSYTVGDATLSWNATFGATSIFNVTSTGPNTTAVKEIRTVGITLTATLTSPRVNATYSFHAQEVDDAFANLTNASVVYVNGSAVPALGLVNDATSSSAALTESLSVSLPNGTRTASLDVNGNAQTSAQFSPALGLVPLNLSGVQEWNSTATVTPSGSWNLSWSWMDNGILGVTGSGSGSSNGTAGAAGTVSLTGYDMTRYGGMPAFTDHRARQSVVLVIQGPLGNYDLFVLVPHGFDLFGGAAHGFDAQALGSASISSQTLYVSSGIGGPMATASSTTFDASPSAMASLQSGPTLAQPESSASPSDTVVEQPMSVPAAQAESKCLTGGCTASTPSGPLGLGIVLVIAGVVVATVVGAFAVVEWRSYSRRRSSTGPVGGQAPSRTDGVPPSAPGAMPPTQGTSPGGASPPGQPPRQV